MYWYPPSKPRKVKGGIRSQARKDKAALSWWTREWLDVLDSFRMGERMNRGRSYARKGQVAELGTSAGKVEASVQGSRSSAYRVSIEVSAIGEQKWKKIAKNLFADPAAAASLLAGQMPDGVEKAFKAAGAKLFPRRSDLETDCTCPDWSNPCKHIAAVFFLLAEEFERDPFLIFKLRGSGRDELLKMAEIKPARPEPRAARPEPARDIRDPLPSDPGKFWGQGLGEYDPGDVFVPKIPAALPKQLGSFPFWRGEDDFADVMEKTYQDASQAGMAAFWGEAVDENGTKPKAKKGRGRPAGSRGRPAGSSRGRSPISNRAPVGNRRGRPRAIRRTIEHPRAWIRQK